MLIIFIKFNVSNLITSSRKIFKTNCIHQMAIFKVNSVHSDVPEAVSQERENDNHTKCKFYAQWKYFLIVMKVFGLYYDNCGDTKAIKRRKYLSERTIKHYSFGLTLLMFLNCLRFFAVSFDKNDTYSSSLFFKICVVVWNLESFLNIFNCYRACSKENCIHKYILHYSNLCQDNTESEKSFQKVKKLTKMLLIIILIILLVLFVTFNLVFFVEK